MLTNIKNKVQAYISVFPEEKNGLSILNQQIKNGDDLFDRKNMTGHITASALIISPTNKILFVFHKVLKKYLLPGGHIEKIDKNLVEAARREIAEETGIKNILLHPWCKENNLPIVLDSHYIPPNSKKNEGQHYHHDFMFIFQSRKTTVNLDESEVTDYTWLPITKINPGNKRVLLAVEKIKKLKII